MKLRPYKENTEIIWSRKMMAFGWCLLAGFIIAVFLVTIGFYLFG